MSIYQGKKKIAGSIDTQIVTELDLRVDTNALMVKKIVDGDLKVGEASESDNSNTVNGFNVKKDVPADAQFTDTVYTHPASHPASMIIGLPTSLPASGGNADTVDGFHAAALTPWVGIKDAAFLNNTTYVTPYVADLSDGATIGLPSAWWHIFYMPHSNAGGGYGAQIALPLNNEALAARYRVASGTTWSTWKPWATTDTYSATIVAWTAQQNINVAGIVATDNPVIDVVLSGDYGTDIARLEAWGNVTRIVTYNGGITVVCYETAPTVAIPIQIKVVR